MKIQKIKNVKTPTRGTKLSAGIDLYVPEKSDEFIEEVLKKNPGLTIFDYDSFLIRPQQRILIPSGIRAEIPKDTVWIVFNKSGVSSKKGLDVLACVIDEDYRGEIHINLVNTSSKDVFVSCGEKITQLLLLPIIYEPIKIVEEISLETERSDGGFGHTDKKN